MFANPSFMSVFARYDIGTGDRFYDDPCAWYLPWGEVAEKVRSSLVVLSASSGQFGRVQFQIEFRQSDGKWGHSKIMTATQAELIKAITLLSE